MAVSRYFNHLEEHGEINLFDSLVQESIQISGYDVSYIKRTDFEIDPVLYEPKASVFEHGFRIEANIPDNLMNWEGQGTTMNQFGITIQNQGNILFSKTRWEQIQKERAEQGLWTIDRPYEGDLIYFGYGHKKYTNTLFIINQVDFSDMSWQMGRNFVYRCLCSLYSPSHNEMVMVDEFNLTKQVDDAIKSEEVIRQNDNIDVIGKTLQEFSEKHPFGGF